MNMDPDNWGNWKQRDRDRCIAVWLWIAIMFGIMVYDYLT